MSLSNAERQRRYIARLKASAAKAEPGRAGAGARLAEIEEVRKELAAAKARIAELERKIGTAVTNGGREAPASDDPLQLLQGKVQTLLERGNWNRKDNVPAQVAIGALLQQAQAHIRKSVGPRPPSTSSKKKAWQKRFDQQWRSWLDACGKLPGGRRVLMSDSNVRFLLRAARV